MHPNAWIRAGFVLGLAAAFVLCSSATARAAFLIAAQSSCFGTNVYAYNFSSYAVMPDFTVKVSSYAVMPDIRMKLVSSPQKADLILADDLSEANVRICKKSHAFGITTIRVSAYSVMPDITVQLSTSVLTPDFKTFVASELLSQEEAAALFAVIWKSNRRSDE